MKNINFLINNPGFSNKGDYLMIRSVIKVLKNQYPDCRIGIPVNHKYDVPLNENFFYCLRIHKYRKPLFHKFLRIGSNLIESLSNLLPTKLLESNYLIKAKDIDCIFDTSGYYLADHWDIDSVFGMAKLYKKYRSQGTKVILMPKAFGPMNEIETVNSAKELFENSDLIFVRDSESMNLIKKNNLYSSSIFQFPDYTALTEPILNDNMKEVNNNIIIIPNIRFVNKAENDNIKEYLNFLSFVISKILKNGLKIIILIHSNPSDFEIINKLDINNNIEIIDEQDPQKIKGYISQAKFIISSRYHGIINALSQGIPAIGTSWTFKYEELYEEYNIKDLLIKDIKNFERISILLDNLINNYDFYFKYKNIILRRAISIKQKNIEMWNKIFNLINS